MPQISYSQDLDKGKPGMKADSRFDIVSSLIAAVIIPLARGVFKMYGQQNRCRLPVANQVVLTDDAGTYTAGSIAATINGQTITQAYSSNKNDTLTALAAAIQAGVTGVYSAVYSSGSHTITIKSRNTDISATTVDISGVTGTMAAVTAVASCLDTIAEFVGIALDPGNLVQDSSGLCQYVADDVVSVGEQVAVYLYPEETVTSDDDVYVRIQTNGAKLPGMFGTSSDSSKCLAVTGARWAEGGDTTHLAKLILNLPQ
jgi:hypothetical protein